ncbi:MAG: asparaginase [Caryophanon sp.]|nr:asparaginase [Caryophanon sp.]
MTKNILLIHTGGTISMKLNNESGAVVLNDENPLKNEAALEAYANIIELEAFNLPSPHITPQHMLTLRDMVCEQAKREQLDGVVITHGTDTLEETAYFLDMTTQFDFPIVLTGAMRSFNELGADGVYNLVEAVRVATDEQARNKGVLVVMNDEVHLAFNITKTSTSSVNTFQSPQYGPIGLVTKKQVHIHHSPVRRQYVNVTSLQKRVALLKVYAGMEPDLLNYILTANYDGLVLEALGQGNVPPFIAETLQHFLAANIPVVIVSRCFNGIAEGVYGYDGGGKQLEDAGVLFANGLNGQKARLKLMLALNAHKPVDLRTFFA